MYRQIGYRVIVTSAVSGLGIDEVQAALKDRVSVLWGKSGVGKTSLLNAIEPGLGLRVKAVNDHNSEGRHTTTHLEMFDLSFGGSVIDTPGQRAFKIWDNVGRLRALAARDAALHRAVQVRAGLHAHARAGLRDQVGGDAGRDHFTTV